MAFHLYHVNIEKSGSYGVVVQYTKRNTITNCNINTSKRSGILVQKGGLITINGTGTSVHNNVTGGNEKEYGLYSYDSAATMRLIPPLTKERISIHNGGGGNYGGEGKIVVVDKDGFCR